MNYLVLALAALLAAAVVGGTVYYFVRQRQIENEQMRNQFRSALLRSLRKHGNTVNLTELIDEHGISSEQARDVAEEIYEELVGRAVADGKITDSERKQLDQVSAALELGAAANQIEFRCKQSRYTEYVSQKLGDGSLTENDAQEVRRVQRQLGLSDKVAAQAARETSVNGYRTLFLDVLRDGVITEQELADLDRMRNTLGLSKQEAFGLVRKEAVNFFRELVCEFLQDGEVGAHEIATLQFTQAELAIPDHEAARYWKEIDHTNSLARYAKGKLPIQVTRSILEGGELCHWEGPCTHHWSTPTRTMDAQGSLLISSKRIIFTSPAKNFEFSPAKIINLKLFRQSLCVTTTSSRGTGHYEIGDPRELEAIMLGIAKRFKYLQSESFDSVRRRHIPGDVKRAVWARDGGQCVQCGATEYLEFDHIIPHSRGGSNTEKNIQLLCRKCNNLKRDRI